MRIGKNSLGNLTKIRRVLMGKEKQLIRDLLIPL